MDFKEAILTTILKNNNNNYTDNFDRERFGKNDPLEPPKTLKTAVKKVLFKNRVSIDQQNNNIYKIFNVLIPYYPELEKVYNNLGDNKSRELMVLLLCYKMLGHRKIKLPLNNESYFRELKKMHDIADVKDFVDPNFMHLKLYKFDLSSVNKNVKLYYVANGVLIDFIIEQYKYKSENIEIEASPGDVVIDAGGCWGDTALYFADKIGDKGKVYTFEFIPNNIKILEQNLSLNRGLEKNIQLIKKPVWDKSNLKVYFKDFGPASRISFDEFKGYTGTTETMAIDDLCKDMDKVDFIKMDIEGAEPYALEGAKNTIMKFKPKLAIAIYHSMNDFINIPLWILNLNLGYRIYMGHYTINEEETVIFAEVDK